jgi:hypothetical protein
VNADERTFILALDASNKDDLEAIKSELIALRESTWTHHTRFYVWLTVLTVTTGTGTLMFLTHLLG